VTKLRNIGAFDDLGFLDELHEKLMQLESEDHKTELDVMVDQILFKDATEVDKVNEILSLEYKSPQVFNSIVIYFEKLDVPIFIDDFTNFLKSSESCTTLMDNYLCA